MKSLIGSLSVLFCIAFLGACSHFSDSSKERDRAKLYLQLSSDMFAQRNYPKSLEFCLESIQVDPDFAPALNHLGIIYMETKRFNKAEEAFNQALKKQPQYPEVLNNLGVLMNRQDRFSEAVGFFDRALKSDNYVTPENALTNMGYSYFRLGNLTKAKVYHQRALDILPDFCLANKNLGDVYAKDKKFPKAVDFYNKALSTCPLYEESHYKLGLALMKMGQRNMAKNELEKLVQRHKAGPYVDRSQEVLKFLN
ncbi:MAG: tetratricopeptide repeat protein [Proteobacteria bacterium]|nr:tetratricopeptide repeat protein [Pseudomonadota bacterium]